MFKTTLSFQSCTLRRCMALPLPARKVGLHRKRHVRKKQVKSPEVRVWPFTSVKTLSLKLPFPVLGFDIYHAALRLCPQGQTVLRRYFKTQACQPAHQPRQRRWRQLDVQNKTALIAVYLLSCQVSRMVAGDGQASGPASMLAKQVATKVGLPHVTL